MNKTLDVRLNQLAAIKGPKTLGLLIDVFADKSFAILFMLLMAMSALPVPTGGITNIFELTVLLLSLELILGRNSVWLPKKWIGRELPEKFWQKSVPKLVRLIRKLDRWSRPRLSSLSNKVWYTRLIGLLVFIMTCFAFLAPPFSGLDTLPSMGVILLSLSLIMEDILLAAAGLIVGSVGIAIILVLGNLAFQFI